MGGDVPAGANSGALKLFPAVSHTGFDGEHMFSVPIKTRGGKPTAWRATDPSAVMITETADGALVTMKKAADVTIIATLGSDSATAQIKAKMYSASDWTTGRDRYNNGVIAIRTADGGVPDFDDSGDENNEDFDPSSISFDRNAACNFCHGEASMLGIRHTPTQIAQYSDEQVLAIFTMGMKPPGATMRIFTSDAMWKEIHQWQMSEQERQGILVYLRALTPAEMGPLPWERGMGGAMRDAGAP